MNELENKKTMKINKNRQNNPDKEEKAPRASWFQVYYKTTVNKTVQNWHKDRLIDQQNRIESLGINPGTHGQLIYNKGDQSIKWRKDSFFNKGF